MYRVHGMALSGNCYKLKLALTQLDLPYEWIKVNSVRGETRTPEFRKLNPNMKVPVLEFDDGTLLPESNAGLWYLAEGSPLIPDSRLDRARVLQWMFFEQYTHEPAIAVARYLVKFLGSPPGTAKRIEDCLERGHHALAVMEQHLTDKPFFVAERYTIADIALYAYTHCAAEGGFDLTPYMAVQAWLARVRETPGYVPMG
ncbi:MAG: glutathione S-transferase family protein [Gammaproteobacteria bacterium]